MTQETTAPVAVIVTGHFYDQKRRGSIHWLTDEFLKHGWRVRFVTVGYSQLSRFVGDVRLKALARPPVVGLQSVSPQLETAFQYPLFHPIDLRASLLNRIAEPLFRMYPRLLSTWIAQLTKDATLVVLESGLPLLLAPAVKRASTAKLVYRVNDDIRAMRSPPMLHAAELAYAPLFDRISLASPVLARRFDGIGKIGMDPMGLDKTLFDQIHPDPYAPRWEKEVVCAGTSHFDAEAVKTMARLRPSWRFHVIGRLRTVLKAQNILAHGEMPFDAVVPFVQHADYAIAPYKDVPGMEYQAHHSNRLLQYAYVGLPTLVPKRVSHPDFPLLIGYDPKATQSIHDGLHRLAAYEGHSPIPVATWEPLFVGISGVAPRHTN